MSKKRVGRKAVPKEAAVSESDSREPLIELSEEEQWRLINESGILNKAGVSDKPTVPLAVPESDFADEVFNAILLIIPFSFALLLMEILIHRQYGQEPTLEDLTDRMLPGIPIISIFVFYTNRYKRQRWMQFLLFVAAIVAGIRMIWMVNRANWKVNKKQCPPLATAWIYTIVQLDLPQAVVSLAIVGVWAWIAGMKILY